MRGFRPENDDLEVEEVEELNHAIPQRRSGGLGFVDEDELMDEANE